MRTIRKRKPPLPKNVVVEYNCPYCTGKNIVKIVNENSVPIRNEFTMCKGRPFGCKKMYYLTFSKKGQLLVHQQELKDGEAD
jgi:hypothetical protein